MNDEILTEIKNHLSSIQTRTDLSFYDLQTVHIKMEGFIGDKWELTNLIASEIYPAVTKNTRVAAEIIYTLFYSNPEPSYHLMRDWT